jgi:uncharacterized protein YecE (DUF72 family)
MCCAALFEFRHDSWFDDEIFDLLKSRNISLCIADTDDLATPKKITADYGYLRLRAKIIKGSTSNGGSSLSASRNQIGKTPSSTSNMRKVALPRS